MFQKDRQRMTAPRTIYFVDTDDDTRKKLAEVGQLMQIPFATFSHGVSFLDAFENGPGCLVTELRIEDMSGLELQQRIAQAGSKLPVIFVTKHVEPHLIVKAMQNGATTVLQKPATKQELWDAVSEALAHDREIRRIDIRHQNRKRRLARLTTREKEVLNLIVGGLPNKAIARRLDISLRTVESRRQKIFEKTKSQSLAELMRLVILADPDSPD
jgi:FixJ family two-component response regulator